MTNETVQWIAILILPFIAIAAYLKSVKAAKEKFGAEYIEVVSSFQWKCVKGLALIVLYCAISVYQGGWEKLLSGVAFSAAAFSFFTMTMHELACGISINHNVTIPKSKAAVVSRLVIILQAISLTSLIFVFQAKSVHWAATAAQAILLIISLVTFYGIGSVVNLLRIGYTPLPLRQ
ncbi:hypothetical protein [Pseudomonas sp. LFM046]|uniref:hypothetical protein n=1 Tax=Pseudomonas sp. LFM046 TaxID=1608357 RepID=UPI0005CFAC37|nr:hypothetical protein [Pseudomonas sp. LFM046]